MATRTTPVLADGVVGLGNPPLPVSKTRKDTRHKDGFERRPKKKARGGDATSCIDVANFSHTFTFQLPDKPWSQVSSLLLPGPCLQFLSRIGFSTPTARRFFIERC